VISVFPVRTPVHVNAAPLRSHRESLPFGYCERRHAAQPHQSAPAAADNPARRVEPWSGKFRSLPREAEIDGRARMRKPKAEPFIARAGQRYLQCVCNGGQ
jgi:hypothetical protein